MCVRVRAWARASMYASRCVCTYMRKRGSARACVCVCVSATYEVFAQHGDLFSQLHYVLSQLLPALGASESLGVNTLGCHVEVRCCAHTHTHTRTHIGITSRGPSTPASLNVVASPLTHTHTHARARLTNKNSHREWRYSAGYSCRLCVGGFVVGSEALTVSPRRLSYTGTAPGEGAHRARATNAPVASSARRGAHGPLTACGRRAAPGHVLLCQRREGTHAARGLSADCASEAPAYLACG